MKNNNQAYRMGKMTRRARNSYVLSNSLLMNGWIHTRKKKKEETKETKIKLKVVGIQNTQTQWYSTPGGGKQEAQNIV